MSIKPPTPSIAPSEALPSYESATTPSSKPQKPSAPDEQPDIPPFDPPAFSISPITLSIQPNSFLVVPIPDASTAFPITRALYELIQPLNGRYSSTAIAEISSYARLRDDGRCRRIWDNQFLYSIKQLNDIVLGPKAIAISAQRKRLIQGTVLRRQWGFRKSWEARSHNIDREGEDQTELLYNAKQNRDVIEWKDARGKLVAMEIPATDRTKIAEKIQILVQLDKTLLDMLVAAWVARIWQDVRNDVLKAEEEDAKVRMDEQKMRDGPRGKLHEVKEALGFGHGLKIGGPRSANLFSGPPTLRDDGRIKWS
jgi:hypothetical protein